jgi:hypothetical protein
MEYGGTAYNRTVYASPPLGNDGQRHRRDVARYVSTINPDGKYDIIRIANFDRAKSMENTAHVK